MYSVNVLTLGLKGPEICFRDICLDISLLDDACTSLLLLKSSSAAHRNCRIESTASGFGLNLTGVVDYCCKKCSATAA